MSAASNSLGCLRTVRIQIGNRAAADAVNGLSIFSSGKMGDRLTPCGSFVQIGALIRLEFRFRTNQFPMQSSSAL